MNTIERARYVMTRDGISLDQALEIIKIEELHEIHRQIERMNDEGCPHHVGEDETPTPVGRMM